jgi:acyl-CoA synthetase (NDP forming)
MKLGERPFERVYARLPLDLPPAAGPLGERRSKQLLARYGIPVVKEIMLSPAAIEALTSAPLPFPVAVKLESPDVPHKTEAGAVRLGVQDLPALKQAARDVVAAVRRHRPDVRIEGVLIQDMIAGQETLVGAVNDPTFGPTVTFGLGGVFTELLRDVTHGFAPFDAATARGMIGEIKGSALLNGYRGRPALDVAALSDAIARVSLLIADHADRIGEIDVNPLFVMENGVVAADALIVLR